MNNARRTDPPTPGAEAGRRALGQLLRDRDIMATLEIFHEALGNVFRITLPGFRPVMVAGPEANRTVLVSARHQLSWRPEGDPVTRLLRHGVLIEDGEWHDQLRATMDPSLHKRHMGDYLSPMCARTDDVIDTWGSIGPYDMLDEMRRVALLILLETLYGVDIAPDLPRLWPAILKLLEYISPGAWLIWRRAPRLGYQPAIDQVDEYLYEIIRRRRRLHPSGNTMLDRLIETPWMSDGVIRDQLLTMLIAGHDTSTALLAWTLYLLGSHPDAMEAATAEVDDIVGRGTPTVEQIDSLDFIDRVIKESLRLYPPIHVGTRRALNDLDICGYRVPDGDRLLYSIYLTHRDPKHWDEPHAFNPERFVAERGRRTYEPYSYVPFGGGPRNCIGAMYGQFEAKVVLVRILQRVELELVNHDVHAHMGATLEPRPGVMMRVRHRS